MKQRMKMKIDMVFCMTKHRIKWFDYRSTTCSCVMHLESWCRKNGMPSKKWNEWKNEILNWKKKKKNKKKQQKSIHMIWQQSIQWMQIKNEIDLRAAAMNKGVFFFLKSTDKHSVRANVKSSRLTAFVSEIKWPDWKSHTHIHIHIHLRCQHHRSNCFDSQAWAVKNQKKKKKKIVSRHKNEANRLRWQTHLHNLWICFFSRFFFLLLNRLPKQLIHMTLQHLDKQWNGIK